MPSGGRPGSHPCLGERGQEEVSSVGSHWAGVSLSCCTPGNEGGERDELGEELQWRPVWGVHNRLGWWNLEGVGESWSPSREPTWSPLPPAPTTRGKQTPSPACQRRCWGAGQRARLRASLALSHWRHRRPGAQLPFHRPEARMCNRGPQRGAPRLRVGFTSDENRYRGRC